MNINIEELNESIHKVNIVLRRHKMRMKKVQTHPVLEELNSKKIIFRDFLHILCQLKKQVNNGIYSKN